MEKIYYLKIDDYLDYSWVPVILALYPKCKWASGGDLWTTAWTPKAYVHVYAYPNGEAVLRHGDQPRRDAEPFPMHYQKLKELFA